MRERIADNFDAIGARLREMRGGQAETEEAVCAKCEGGGWVQVYSPNPPAFGECPECYNPHNYPSP